MVLTTFIGVHIRPLTWVECYIVKLVQMNRPIKMCEFITLYLFVSLSGWSASHVARAVYKEHTEQVHGGMTAETQTARCLNRTINSDRKRQKLCAKSVNIVWKAVAGILYGRGHLGLRVIACWRKANVGRDRESMEMDVLIYVVRWPLLVLSWSRNASLYIRKSRDQTMMPYLYSLSFAFTRSVASLLALSQKVDLAIALQGMPKSVVIVWL